VKHSNYDEKRFSVEDGIQGDFEVTDQLTGHAVFCWPATDGGVWGYTVSEIDPREGVTEWHPGSVAAFDRAIDLLLASAGTKGVAR
jgi:hypothetical protein